MAKESFSTYYDLELDKLVEQVNTENHKLVLLQFPDGLKYYGKEVVDYLREKTKAEFFIFFGTCFGGCDVPLYLESLNFTLNVQWGHSVYVKKKEMW
ncbi:MAG: diphthamide synthesis protein [Nanoarchaeota archaeon]